MALTTNLVAYWKMDEASGNAVDSSGAGLTLVNNNTVTFGAGKINNGAQLAIASNNYFSIANASAGALNFSSSFTFAGWVNPTTTGNAIQPIFKQNDGVGAQYTGGIGATGTMFLNLGIGGGFFPYNSTVDAGALTGGVWYHIALVCDRSGLVNQFYFNGSQLGTDVATSAGALNNQTDDFLVGGRKATGTTSGWVDGKLDEWGSWSRALTGAEISSLYNGGSGLSYPFTAVNGNFIGFF